MAVGGGDAFSLPATLLTIILLWSFLQWSAPWWLPELARRHPEREQVWKRFDQSLTQVPALLILIAGLDLLRAYLASDHTYAFLGHLEDAKWFVMILSYAVSSTVCDHFFWPSSLFDHERSSLRPSTLRWHGLLWPLLLFGFLPSDLFSVNVTPLDSVISTSQTSVDIILLSLAGIALACWVHLSARTARRQLNGEPDSFHLTITGVLFLIPILAVAGVMPMAGEWQNFAESVVLGNESTFALVTSLFILILAWPNFLELLTRLHEKRGQAKERRFLGLTLFFAHTLLFTWASGALLLEPLPNVSGWSSAIWLSFSLTLPLAVAGLLGALLPLAGLDERPRSEAWGFLLAITIALQFLTIREPLTATLVPGLGVAMMALPLLATHPEKRLDLPIGRRAFESVLLITLSIAALYFFRQMMLGAEWGYLQGWAAVVAVPFAGLLFVRLPDISEESAIGEEE